MKTSTLLLLAAAAAGGFFLYQQHQAKTARTAGPDGRRASSPGSPGSVAGPGIVAPSNGGGIVQQLGGASGIATGAVTLAKGFWGLFDGDDSGDDADEP